jgi:DNA-binding Lrp family transcriptional regulator
MELSKADKLLIYHLSGDLGDSERPYADLGEKCGLTEGEVIDKIKLFQENGLIRRLGAILWHQRSGISVNAMLVWRIPEDRISEVGVKLAALSYVSHCYQRCPLPVWPFNLYTMIHAKTKEILDLQVKEMANICQAEEWKILESLKEFKKTSIRYFTPTD